MKIRVISNSNEAIKEAKKICEQIDTSLGYVYGPNISDSLNTKNSFFVKFLSLIDKGIALFSPISEEEKEITRRVTKSYSDVIDYIRKEEPRLSDVSHSLYIKNNSKLNQSIDDALLFNISDLFDKLKIGTTYFGSMANREHRKISIETRDFDENTLNETTFFKILKESFSKDEISDFAVLHEFAHTIEFLNRNTYQNINDKNPIMFRFFELLNSLDTPSFVNGGNEVIFNQLSAELDDKNAKQKTENPNLELFESEKPLASIKKYTPLNYNFCKSLSDLPAEIYADVQAMLIRRNLDIEKNIFEPKKFKRKIDTLIKARNKSYLELSDSESDPVSYFGHNTNQALEILKELPFLFEEPSSKISLENIHNISEKLMNVGLSRFILTAVFSSQNTVGQLVTIFDIQAEDKKITGFKNEESFNYLSHMQEFRKQAGKEWLNEFERNREMIQSLPLDRNIQNKLTFYAGIHKETFEERLAQIKSNLESTGSIESLNTSTQNDKEQFQMKLFSSTIEQIKKFKSTRETVSDSSAKPNF